VTHEHPILERLISTKVLLECFNRAVWKSSLETVDEVCRSMILRSTPELSPPNCEERASGSEVKARGWRSMRIERSVINHFFSSNICEQSLQTILRVGSSQTQVCRVSALAPVNVL
jgi:hypothetical protein